MRLKVDLRVFVRVHVLFVFEACPRGVEFEDLSEAFELEPVYVRLQAFSKVRSVEAVQQFGADDRAFERFDSVVRGAIESGCVFRAE